MKGKSRKCTTPEEKKLKFYLDKQERYFDMGITFDVEKKREGLLNTSVNSAAICTTSLVAVTEITVSVSGVF